MNKRKIFSLMDIYALSIPTNINFIFIKNLRIKKIWSYHDYYNLVRSLFVSEINALNLSKCIKPKCTLGRSCFSKIIKIYHFSSCNLDDIRIFVNNSIIYHIYIINISFLMYVMNYFT